MPKKLPACLFSLIACLLLFSACAPRETSSAVDAPHQNGAVTVENQPLAQLERYGISLWQNDSVWSLQVGERSYVLNQAGEVAEYSQIELAVSPVNKKEDLAVWLILLRQDSSGSVLPELHYLLPQEEKCLDYSISAEQLRETILQYFSGTVDANGLQLSLDGVPFKIKLPQEYPEAGFLGFTVMEAAFNLPGHAYLDYYNGIITAQIGLSFASREEALPFAGLDLQVRPLMLPEHYFYAEDYQPLATLTLPEPGAGEDFALTIRPGLRLAGEEVSLIPGTAEAVDPGQAEIIEEEAVYGYKLALPGHWQGQYKLNKAEDFADGDGGQILFYLQEPYTQQTFHPDAGYALSVFLREDYREVFEVEPAAMTGTFFADNRIFAIVGNTALVVSGPTDVQYNMEDPLSKWRYQALRDGEKYLMGRFCEINDVEPYAAYFQEPLSFAPDPEAWLDTDFPDQARAATMAREDFRDDRRMIYYYLETLPHYADAMLYETTLNDCAYYANLPQDAEHQGLFVKLARINDESLGNMWRVVAYQYVPLETAP